MTTNGELVAKLRELEARLRKTVSGAVYRTNDFDEGRDYERDLIADELAAILAEHAAAKEA